MSETQPIKAGRFGEVGVPVWVGVLAAALGLSSMVAGVLGLINPADVPGFVAGSGDLATTWAGRTAGTGAALLVALWLRTPSAFAVAFAASIFRDIGDLVAALSGTGEAPPVVFILVVLVADVAAFVVSARAARQALRGREGG